MTVKAKEILDGKFWILEDEGVKVATLSLSDDRYILSDSNGTRFIKKPSELKKDFGKDISWAKLEITENTDKEVHGFPTSCVPHNPLFDVKQKLPLFTKSNKIIILSSNWRVFFGMAVGTTFSSILGCLGMCLGVVWDAFGWV